MKKKALFVAPLNAQLDQQLHTHLEEIEGEGLLDLVAYIYSAMTDNDVEQFPFVRLSIRQLSAIMDYLDLWKLDIVSFDNLPAGDYTTVWYTLLRSVQSVTTESVRPFIELLREEGANTRSVAETLISRAHQATKREEEAALRREEAEVLEEEESKQSTDRDVADEAK
jgi:hypothetical protein